MLVSTLAQHQTNVCRPSWGGVCRHAAVAYVRIRSLEMSTQSEWFSATYGRRSSIGRTSPAAADRRTVAPSVSICYLPWRRLPVKWGTSRKATSLSRSSRFDQSARQYCDADSTLERLCRRRAGKVPTRVRVGGTWSNSAINMDSIWMDGKTARGFLIRIKRPLTMMNSIFSTHILICPRYTPDPFSVGIDFRRQILTSKVDPRTERIKQIITVVDL